MKLKNRDYCDRDLHIFNLYIGNNADICENDGCPNYPDTNKRYRCDICKMELCHLCLPSMEEKKKHIPKTEKELLLEQIEKLQEEVKCLRLLSKYEMVPEIDQEDKKLSDQKNPKKIEEEMPELEDATPPVTRTPSIIDPQESQERKVELLEYEKEEQRQLPEIEEIRK